MPEYFYFVFAAFSLTFGLLGFLGWVSWFSYKKQLVSLKQSIFEDEFYESR